MSIYILLRLILDNIQNKILSSVVNIGCQYTFMVAYLADKVMSLVLFKDSIVVIVPNILLLCTCTADVANNSVLCNCPNHYISLAL